MFRLWLIGYAFCDFAIANWLFFKIHDRPNLRETSYSCRSTGAENDVINFLSYFSFVTIIRLSANWRSLTFRWINFARLFHVRKTAIEQRRKLLADYKRPAKSASCIHRGIQQAWRSTVFSEHRERRNLSTEPGIHYRALEPLRWKNQGVLSGRINKRAMRLNIENSRTSKRLEFSLPTTWVLMKHSH